MDDSGSWVELLGVTMSGTLTPDRGFKYLDLTGWTGLTASRGQTDPIPGSHGRFRRAVEPLRESRSIGLLGEIRTASNVDLVEARGRLEEALSEGVGQMRVYSPASGIWERYVEIDDLRIDPDHGRAHTQFRVDLIAPDPRRYGPLQVVGPASLPKSEGGVRLPQRMPWNFGVTTGDSRLMIPNAGALPIQPRFRVRGGFAAVTLLDITTGRRLRLEWPAGEASEVVFDCRSRRVEMDGADVTRRMTRRQWFEIPKGETREFRFEAEGVTGDPQMWAEFKIGAW